MNEVFESLYVNRELHAVLFVSVCKKYGLTLTELHVLFFLKKNQECNTATDIVDNLKITKSYVSAAVHVLEERGYIEGCHEKQNRRSIHLHLCDKADEIIGESQKVQEEFLTALVEGFSEEEIENFKQYVQRMTENTEKYLRGHMLNKK